READEGAQDDEGHVKVVDDEIAPGRRTLHEEHRRRHKGEQGGQHVEPGRRPVVRQQRQNARGRGGNDEHRAEEKRALLSHGCSPRCSCRAWMSTVSKRSRMRNRNTPITISATRMENATLISTTSGMPFAPVAARINPFSIDMKPITWLTALRREIIMSSPSRTTESANARSSRASVPASAVIGSITMMERATSPTPASIVCPIL